jgi:hypothetical protein
MVQGAELSPITGDIAAAADVTINTKGGSVTATLKKSLRETLGELSGHLTGAAVRFASGQAIVLLASASRGAEASPAFRVRKISRNRFEITLEADDEEEVDEVTAAFLRLKKDQFEKGKLRLSERMSAADWRRKTAEELADAEALMKTPTATARAE